MLISIIILTTGQAWAQTATTTRVFTSIKELRDGAQTISDKTLNDVVIQFNEATVVAVMKMETKRSNQQNSSIHFLLSIIAIMVYGFRLMMKKVRICSLNGIWQLVAR